MIYTGYVEVPDLVSMSLDTAFTTMKNIGFSAVDAVTDDGSTIWNNSKWKVVKQSVDAGKKVNADGRITLTVTSISASSAASNSSDAGKTEKPVVNESKKSESDSNNKKSEKGPSYTTNDKTTYKNGNSGMYAYKSIGGQVDLYYIIDFDEGVVYDFSDRNASTECTKGKIVSGDLNSTLIVGYREGEEYWENGLFFKWKNQPDILEIQLDPEIDSLVEIYTTDLNDALKIKENRKIIDLTKGIKNNKKESEYELAYARVYDDYTLYYIIDEDKKVCIFYSSSDGWGQYGEFTGDLSKKIIVTYPSEGYSDTLTFLNGYGSDVDSLIEGDTKSFRYKCVSVSEAEKYLKSIHK